MGGRHRRRRDRALVLTAVPVAVALAWGTATAHAAPQDFVTAPDTAQSGTTDTTPVAPPPAPTQERQFLPGYQASPQVQQTEWRSYNDYRSGNQQSSYQNTYYEPAPAPAPQAAPTDAPPALQAAPPTPPPVPTVQRKVIAPIDAPEGYVLVGGELVPYDPNLLDPNLVEQFNNTGAAIQADGGNWLVDNGFADASRADRIAAGTITGVVAGGAAGLAASAVPAAVITGTAAAIGGGLGVAATTGTGAIVWGGPVGWVFIPGAAALAGAGVGAALSAPIVVGLTGAGAAIGGVLGATVLGGEQQIIEEPAPLPAREAVPAPPAPPVTAAPLALDAPSVQSAVDAPVWTEPAFEQATQFTSTVLEQPAVADTVAAVSTAVAPVLDQANAALAGLNLAI
ncbi:hypothetical protein CH306_27620 [Rhodococcus sp. 15-725-2-2b]|nr:hypothetical protein [Rhodococcus fascians]OZC60625.1 hypothetical protein CH277_27480 [Rhodococcus sp. 06-469-3-2]OZD41036.1 hypothetical protein CH264_25440 [Rhodococcus sp. 06-1477-1A]OZE66534.1 hypothetical protein CH306_27620 [Rhodococcus sp. 15-725-2-2b]MBY4238407.1 hypothetical protein [Rhodococcus fascians]